MSDAFARLQDLLRQLFQFESKELDFGIYRIMNQKRGEIEHFIQNGLAEVVEESLKGGAIARQSAQAEELRQATDRIRESFGEYAIDPKGELNQSFHETPLGRQYLDLRSKTGEAVDLEELKATIFNHVYTFFGRYYDNGDFLSRRRYSRRHKYAVPYNGEEVYLHWANADQYYVKTGEHFTDYRFKSGGVTIHFELAAADTEQNNVKGEKRFFVPRAKDAAYDANDHTLTIPFEYRPLTAKEQTAYGTRNQQEKIIEEVTADLPALLKKHPEALAALEPAGELERHLRRYTRRNTSDFFVHKDLKGFLKGELDFYLKNEVLDVDDLDAWGPERSEGWFEVMRAVKTVGRGVIAFLAQIEDFQKRLFEKKKLVVSAEYCLTLDRVPEELYPEVAANDAQREEWVRLFAIDGIEENITTPGYSEPLTTDFLKTNQFLVLDTKLYDEDFKDRLLASIEDLDEGTDGLLIESENFQALSLLQKRYREEVKCIYIDPPYNTAASEILYKNDFKHSSWLALLENRLREARPLLQAAGILCVTIDDAEFHRLYNLLLKLFGSEEAALGTAVIRSNPSGRGTVKGFSMAHEYAIFIGNDEHASIGRLPKSEKQLARYDESDEKGSFEWVNFRKHGGADANRVARPRLFYPIYASSDGAIGIPPLQWQESKKKWVALEEPSADEEAIYPVNTKGEEKRWKWGHERVLSDISELRAGLDQAKRTGIYMKSRTEERKLPSSWWDKKEYYATAYGTNLLSHILGNVSAFSFPKAVHATEDCLRVANLGEGDLCLDFFAGSGTTGHAVIDLNREDGGNRKYILVEMGEYFETVMKPRILKVIYSKDWKDGKPVSREGTSHAFKYLKLESYEDALNNIAFTHEADGQEALALYGDDYLLRYMLDFETRGSDTLLNVEKLATPFRYRLRLRDGEASRDVPVDLPETFAYLLGLRVRSRKAYHDGQRRYLVYRGSTPERGEADF